ncbi:MAG: hypothetical protein IJP52_01725 [Paludibacteraceae bacterium]|nr:hypothetical protein [Paludibacteraceae bacterium]
MKLFWIVSLFATCAVSLFAADENTAVVTFTSSACPVGAVSEKAIFSVADGKQVYFSKGLLQYQASTNTWRFAGKQYDIIEAGSNGSDPVLVADGFTPGSNNLEISSTYTGWIDLFCWASSGYHDEDDAGNLYYQPYVVDNSNSGGGYGPSDGTTGIAGTNYDWGIYLPISNGGNEVGQWRTLTAGEWSYLLNRSGDKCRYGWVGPPDYWQIGGLILLPDEWDGDNPWKEGDFYDNYWDLEEWSVLEAKGAILLPEYGYKQYGYNITQRGAYWLSNSHWNNSNRNAEYLYFHMSQKTVTKQVGHNNLARSTRCAVRLVRDK